MLFNPDFTGSQNAAGTCGYGDSTKTVEYIDVRLVYNCNENSARFDKIQFNIDESGTSYGYDAEGNLISSSDRYSYDDKGQLVRHYDRTENKTFVYRYDSAGNILSKKTYPYVESQDAQNAIIANPQDTVIYTYDSGAWGDVLKSYDGKSAIGDTSRSFYKAG